MTGKLKKSGSTALFPCGSAPLQVTGKWYLHCIGDFGSERDKWENFHRFVDAHEMVEVIERMKANAL